MNNDSSSRKSLLLVLFAAAAFLGLTGARGKGEQQRASAATQVQAQGHPQQQARGGIDMEKGMAQKPVRVVSERSQKMRERLEELFIWRVSDKLELTPAEESKFRDEYHQITEEKSKLSDDIENTLDQIDKEKDNPAESAKLLANYESSQRKYDETQSKEMFTLSKLFGTKRMVQYVLLKREMRQKFKEFLVSNNAGMSNSKDVKPATVLKEPEVYQEK